MGFDLRLPIGALFALFGVILAGDGLIAHRLVLGINVNLWWGLVMLLFGGVDARLRGAIEEPRPPHRGPMLETGLDRTDARADRPRPAARSSGRAHGAVGGGWGSS